MYMYYLQLNQVVYSAMHLNCWRGLNANIDLIKF